MSPTAEKIILTRYWELYAKEDMPKTPKITEELDHIEQVITCERLGQQLALPSGP